MALKGPILAFALAALAGAAMPGGPAGGAATPAREPAWQEVKWPFLMDQWGTGRAFQCAAAECGAALKLYVRPKIGFCNCTTGVADDAELDRVGDVDLVDARFAPRSEGHPIAVGWMTGRSRPYSADAGRTVLALAFNDKCDVVVATLTGDGDLPRRAEEFAIRLLNSERVLHWVQRSLGLS
jgi:hypothetical protein